MAAPQLSREKVSEILNDYRSSGLTQQQFCDSHNLRKSTFTFWLTRERKESSNGFVRLNSSRSSSSHSGSNLVVDLPDGSRISWRGKGIPQDLLVFLEKRL